MRFISRPVHGILDYIIGVALLLAPSLFGFSEVEPARNIALALGVFTIAYSALTAYEAGLFKVLPFSAHLGLDLLGGALLLFSPWIFGFADRLIFPHVLVGALEIVVSLCTRRTPSPAPIATSR